MKRCVKCWKELKKNFELENTKRGYKYILCEKCKDSQPVKELVKRGYKLYESNNV